MRRWRCRPEARTGWPTRTFTGREWRASDGPTQVQWVERGPIWTTVCLRSHVLEAPIVQEIRLHNHEPRVDLTTTIDWNGSKNTQVRLALPYNVPGGEVTYEVPYGNVVFGKGEVPNTPIAATARAGCRSGWTFPMTTTASRWARVTACTPSRAQASIRRSSARRTPAARRSSSTRTSACTRTTRDAGAP